MDDVKWHLGQFGVQETESFRSDEVFRFQESSFRVWVGSQIFPISTIFFFRIDLDFGQLTLGKDEFFIFF